MINDKEDGEVIESYDGSKSIVSFNKIYEEDLDTKYISNYWVNRQSILYAKEEQVGEGTFGKVFKARYKLCGKFKEDPLHKVDYVALKKILMDNEKEGFPITAIREVMILKRLNHKNIINLLEIVTSKPTEKNKNRCNIYLVFDYMEHDLNGLLERKVSYDVPQIKCILYQIMSGVLYLHNNNIIHRDIKGANILLNNKGDIKIADFGLARNHIKNTNQQYTNKVVTLWYRSPELLFGATKYDFAIDIWSVG